MTTTVGLLVLAAVLAASWYASRRRWADRAGDARLSTNDPDAAGRYYALSVRFGTGACEPARSLHGQRFLSAEAPRLPLAGCDADECDCRIVHHRDRRTGDERRSPFQRGFGGSAGRIGEDRRRTDRRRADRGVSGPVNQ